MSEKNKSLKERLAELDQILEWFDTADIDLDEAMQKFEQGTKLAEDIKNDIANLENKVEVIKHKID